MPETVGLSYFPEPRIEFTLNYGIQFEKGVLIKYHQLHYGSYAISNDKFFYEVVQVIQDMKEEELVVLRVFGEG